MKYETVKKQLDWLKKEIEDIGKTIDAIGRNPYAPKIVKDGLMDNYCSLSICFNPLERIFELKGFLRKHGVGENQLLRNEEIYAIELTDSEEIIYSYFQSAVVQCSTLLLEDIKQVNVIIDKCKKIVEREI